MQKEIHWYQYSPTTVLFIFCLIILIRILVDILIYTEPKGPTETVA